MKVFLKYIGLFVLGLFLLWVGLLGFHAIKLNILYQNARSLTQKEMVNQMPLFLDETYTELSAVRKLVKPFYPIFKYGDGVPLIGIYLDQIEPIVEVSTILLPDIKNLYLVFEPIIKEIDQLSTDPRQNLKKEILLGINKNDELINQLILDTKKTKIYWDRINLEIFPEKYQNELAFIFEHDRNFLELVEFINVLPDLAGLKEDKIYLVIAQNQDELRATGGFISAIGTVQISNGELINFNIDDSYAIDDFSKGYPSPPDPIAKYMLAGYLVPRDANWYPDFPTSAKIVSDLYTLSTDTTIDGVIAFDQSTVIGLLDVIGEIEVTGVEEKISAQNVENYMWDAWGQELETGFTIDWWKHRKDFMKNMGSTLLSEIENMQNPQEIVSLGIAVEQLIKSGHLNIYVDNQSVQSLLNDLGWDGSLKQTSSDFLSVVDSNIGFNKMDGVIERKIKYQVDLRDLSTPKAQIVISYTNPVEKDIACIHEPNYGEGYYEDMQQRCYWNYWRVYVPIGTKLLKVTAPQITKDKLLSADGWNQNDVIQSEENGYQVFEGMLVLPTHSTQEIILDVVLPKSVLDVKSDGTYFYEVLIQKQHGVNLFDFNLEVLFPENTMISGDLAFGGEIKDNKFVFEKELSESVSFGFHFEENH
jgi:hypothetical protein